MRSFLAVNISLALLQSSLAAPILRNTNIRTGDTINCSNSAATPVAAPPPVPAATNPFAKTIPQRPVPTGKFGPRSSIGGVGILMNSFGFPASSLPTFGQGNPGFGRVDPSISQINPGFGQGDPGFGQVNPGFRQGGPNLGQPVSSLGQDPSQFSWGGLNYGQVAFDPTPSAGGLDGAPGPYTSANGY
ncbi:hypothetical protein MJO28_011406 [Puccinia striiformis f. sp. tritici]|uniref:Uncharacterized protein n=1 Tax=Puccinia striiformis f. sp. tritici TaxID=168172 RepID=A0ACC0E406_9BASI|nr:hypothetical protein MJO28_011406 [Puccinia striiformis f. sp. tritici]